MSGIPRNGLERTSLSRLVVAIPVSGASVLAIQRLGYHPFASIALVVAIGLGGGFHLTLRSWASGISASPKRLAVNLGGCLIPLGIACERAWHWPRSALIPALASVVLVAVLSFFLARPVAGRGVVIAWPLTGLLAAALGLILAPARVRPSTLAFVSGLIGPLLGGEIPYLPRLFRSDPIHASVGGDGLLDGLVWSSLLAAWMAVPANP